MLIDKKPSLWVANWKMYGSLQTIKTFINSLEIPSPLLSPVLSFPFPYLSYAYEALVERHLHKHYSLAAQTCSPYNEGPYTGQVSASMIKDLGVSYVMLGHPERKESLSLVSEQLYQATQASLIPLVCFQHPEDLPLILSPTLPFLYLAYEPAVGASCIPEGIRDSAELCRKKSKNLPLLYGGGVSLETVASLQTVFDGFLVGRASLNASSWNHLLEKAAS